TEELLSNYAWYVRTAGDRSWPVGALKPNDLGLFDMLGNASEWMQDRWRYHKRPQGGTFLEDEEDTLGIDARQERLMRAGQFASQPVYLRAANRYPYVPAARSYTLGLRPARTIPSD